MHLPGGTESGGERTFPEERQEEDPLLALTRLRVSSGPSPVWAGGAGQDGSREHWNQGFPDGGGMGAGGGCWCVGFGHSFSSRQLLPPSERGYRSSRRFPLGAIAQGHGRALGTRGPRRQAAGFAYHKVKS